MMNKILTLILMLMLTLTIQAQTYTVYSTIGTARIVEGKKLTLLKPRKQISAKTRLQIDAESAVTVLDEKNCKMYSFSTEGVYPVEQLVKKASNRGKTISKQYLSYLVKQLFSEGSQKMAHPDTYMQVTATSYRSTSNDSLLFRRIAESVALQSSIEQTIEQCLCDPALILSTDIDVSFELISCDTGFEIQETVEGNSGSYVRVHNNTEESVYVNVLNIDRMGNKYLVLPVDEAATCAHLLVPPMSTVSFKSEPFIFTEEPSEESFILVATHDPVDFSILMENSNRIVPLNPSADSAAKNVSSNRHSRFTLGLSRNIYSVVESRP